VLNCSDLVAPELLDVSRSEESSNSASGVGLWVTRLAAAVHSAGEIQHRLYASRSSVAATFNAMACFVSLGVPQLYRTGGLGYP
jgi:hypothetical protein